ncbi:hypothetical protein [Salinimicrobium soli]|uniref:hypothetical protein n=1 Tax=Salinimicrobium soli TaxID=1254399 RepID=UPI003AAF05D2
MKRTNLVGLTCAEAAVLCNKAEYKEASSLDKLKLKLHLFLCKTCDEYYEDNRKLSSLINKADLKFCTSEEKEAYRQRLKEEQLLTLKDQEEK